MLDLSPGDTINTKYVIESKIGAGGMGSVYLAVQVPLARRVALKLMGTSSGRPMTQAKLEAAKRRFFREASLCARLQHPNIITIYDYGEVESGPYFGSYFLAMEYLHGETLDTRIQSTSPMAPSEVVGITIEIVRGLRDAHSHGVVHRDLKPDNVMLVPGDDGTERVVILDFGLVQEFGEEQRANITSDDIILGTPMYIAPEQILRKGPDPRSDIYSLGIVMYEALAGEHPFNDPSVIGMLNAHLNQPVPKLRERPATAMISPELERLVAKMIEKDPAHRFQTADELLRDLRSLPEADTSLSVIIPKGVQGAPSIIVNTTSQYQLGTRLSRGVRSIVCEATHSELGRKVVVKLLVPSSPEEEARIIHALPSLALLRHPSNVRVYDIGTAKSGSQTIPFFVMEQLRGEKLSERLLRVGKLDPNAVIALGQQLIQALAETHTVGLIHGGLDPNHIVLTANMGGDLVKVFGYPVSLPTERTLATLAPPPPILSPYVPPEVVGGGWPRESSDIYALGKILHACLTGSPDTPLPAEPADLVALIHRASAPRPADRFDSIRGLWQAWKSVDPQSGQSISSIQMGRRSTGITNLSNSADEQLRHQIWLLGGDPGPDGLVVERALELITSALVLPIPPDRHEALLQMLIRGDVLPPSVVIMGLLHAEAPDPLLTKFPLCTPTKRILLATAFSPEKITKIINTSGLDQLILLPSTPQAIAASIEQHLARVDTRLLRFGTGAEPSPLSKLLSS